MITLLIPLMPEKLREKEAWSSNILHVSVLSPLSTPGHKFVPYNQASQQSEEEHPKRDKGNAFDSGTPCCCRPDTPVAQPVSPRGAHTRTNL